MSADFPSLLIKVRACTLCRAHLPFDPRPILQLHPDAKILIAGQAPGIHTHRQGVPFCDASGTRLRDWMGISRDAFYDPKQIAVLPMGFCYPGSGKSGDLPPRSECAATWRDMLLAQLPRLQLTVALGRHAFQYHVGKPTVSLTDTVKSWRSYWPSVIPLPHPSPRNNVWLKRNPWFQTDVIPSFQSRVAMLLGGSDREDHSRHANPAIDHG